MTAAAEDEKEGQLEREEGENQKSLKQRRRKVWSAGAGRLLWREPVKEAGSDLLLELCIEPGC